MNFYDPLCFSGLSPPLSQPPLYSLLKMVYYPLPLCSLQLSPFHISVSHCQVDCPTFPCLVPPLYSHCGQWFLWLLGPPYLKGYLLSPSVTLPHPSSPLSPSAALWWE
uniref:Uncharacterized protein n=1 Tax=Anguilla anguilla TaxID=7936 RepID=A0A0E9WEL1_ANGAN